MKKRGGRAEFSQRTAGWVTAVALIGLINTTTAVRGSETESCPPPPPQAKDWQELNDSAEKAYYAKDFASAEELFGKALSEAEKQKIEIERARTLNSLGVLFKDEKKYEKAEVLLKEALAIREKLLGANHACTGVTLNNLGELYEDEDKLPQAEDVLMRSLKIAESNGKDNAHAAVVLNNLGALYYGQHKMDEAVSYFKRSLTAFQQSRPDDPQLREIMEVLLNIYQSKHKYPEFRSLYVEFARTNPNASPEGLLKAAHVMAQRADEFSSGGLSVDAEAMYNRSLALFEAAGQKTGSDFSTVREKYIALLRRLKRDADAEQLSNEQ